MRKSGFLLLGMGLLSGAPAVLAAARRRSWVDRYKVVFRHGTTEWKVNVGDDGKLTVANFDGLR